jgi:hypothetical protein
MKITLFRVAAIGFKDDLEKRRRVRLRNLATG